MKPPSLSRRTIAIAAAIALVPALWLGGQRLFSDSDGTGKKTGVIEQPIPPVTTPGTGATTPAPPTQTPAGTPTAPDAPAKLTRVPASAPRSLVVKGLLEVGFDESVTPTGGVFTAGSTAEAARWEARGLPGSPGTDTVVLIGKVYRQGASAFDDLPRVKVGTKVVIRTDEGALTYTVRSASDRPAAGLIDTPDVSTKAPGRLVLIGILFDGSDDERTGQYRVVVAQLTSARRS